MSGMRRIAVALLVATLGACAQTGPGPAPISGTTLHWIDEPVLGGRIAVHEAGAGNGRAVLLVHGIGESGARDFQEQIAWLRESFHVVAPDLPGFGESDKGNRLYSPANYADVLKRVADRFFGRPFALVGHSMGAVVALRYAGTYPQDVEQLVVMGAPGVLHRVSTTGQYLTALGMAFVPPALDPSERIASLARRLAAPFGRPGLDPDFVLGSPDLRQTVLDGEPSRIAALALVNEDLSDALPRVLAPTLILWGAKDDVAPLRNGRVLAWMLPHARLQTIEGVGHTPMTESPGRLRALLESFLASGLPPGPYAVGPIAEPRGEGVCRWESGRVFEGEYDRLTIEGCTRTLVRYARVRELSIVDSTVSIDDSVIGGGTLGMLVRNSNVVVTGGRIEGGVAIRADASSLDLAGVEIEGGEAAVAAEQPSSVVFSLCRVRSPRMQGVRHNVSWVTADHPL
ncbi:MAG TPA: alpha/beta hydrolase [Burkholderiales bacterium]|nr:alpha/beta hydrolase [Burkholderiales bacterium]